MKNLILLIFVFGFYATQAQEFKTTEKYTLMNQRNVDDKEAGDLLIDVVLSQDTSNSITTLIVDGVAPYKASEIKVLTNPDLEGIVEILKVSFAYTDRCSSTDSYYFLVDEHSNIVALPHIENQYCDGLTKMRYVFPSQQYGQEGVILRTKIQYNKNYKIKDVNVLQSFVWNDDDFDNDAAYCNTLN